MRTDNSADRPADCNCRFVLNAELEHDTGGNRANRLAFGNVRVSQEAVSIVGIGTEGRIHRASVIWRKKLGFSVGSNPELDRRS